MSVSGIQIGIWVFLVADIIFHAVIFRYLMKIDVICSAIKEEYPSVQLEQCWIPVSEKLPEDSQFVLMTIRRMNEHYNHEPFISVGYISWNQSAWWCAHAGDCKSNDVRVDAWMPLPEPYGGEPG